MPNLKPKQFSCWPSWSCYSYHYRSGRPKTQYLRLFHCGNGALHARVTRRFQRLSFVYALNALARTLISRSLQAELNAAQALVIVDHGFSVPELEFSFAYYNSGPGRDRRIIDAASTVRKMLGKHL